MDGSTMFDHLEDLEKSRTNWRIKVRITRMWPTISPENGAVKGFNLIMLDDDNNHVHAYVYPDNWYAIGKDVKEGDVCIIENFQVRDTIGRLKPVSTKFALRLLNSTRIQPVKDDIMIPLHKFEIMDLGDLFEEGSRYAADDNPEYAIDVMGVIEDFEKLKRISTKYGERDIVRFRLTDGSVSNKVSVWGELAVTTSENYEKELQKPVIAIVTSTKLTIFRSSIQIGTLPSSKIYLNINVEAVEEFRRRLQEEGYKSSETPSETTNTPVTLSPMSKLSLKDLTDKITKFSEKSNVLITFKISNIEDEDNWWYNSCHSCHEELEKVERKFKCTECPRSFSYGEKRFRILVLADDKTFACNVLLMDRVVKRIARTTATNLLNIMREVPSNEMPEVLKKMVGKEITVKIVLSKANVSGDSNIYKAVDVCEDSLANKTIFDYSPIPKFPSLNQSETVDLVDLSETPGSSTSVSKKIKMEP